jgi:DNA primase
VAGKIPERTIDEIRDRTDILGVVGKYVTLKKAGRNFLGLCPFHAEKTPSFSVNPEKGIYKCFGCGKGGSAITFLMEIEGMSFVDAVRDLAGRCGVRIPEEAGKKAGSDDPTAVLFAVNESARAYFAENLTGAGGAKAAEYLKKRGLTAESVRTFQIGYAPPGWEGLVSHLKRAGRPERLLIAAGLASEGKRGGAYDRFRDRIMFPIRDHRERCVGFGGRNIGPDEPKYLNSPETAIYHKGEVLYGLDVTRDEIRKTGCAVIVEGYLDLIALFQAGVKNVAATLGTALTKQHLDRLSKFTRQAVLIFDPDEAGMKAAERTLPLFGEGEMYARAAVLPEGLDPDDFVRKNGAEAFLDIVDAARDLFDFVIERVFERHNLDTTGGVSLALDESAAIIGVIRKKADQDLYIRTVTERLGVREESVRDAVARLKKKGAARHRNRSEAPETSSGFNPMTAEARLFKVAVNFPAVLADAGLTERHLGLFEDEVLRRLVGEMLSAAARGEGFRPASLIESVASPALRDELIGLSFVDSDEIEDNAAATEIARECIGHLEEKERKRRLREITRTLKEGASADAVTELLKEKMDYTKNLKR